GVCATCREIDEGRFVDLIEVDAASRTKVEDTRELLENVQYAPTRGRYKVYLIDEVHMLSNSSFNALLKTLEEPPPHVKFLLATTDPQKLPVTVLSRCLQFALKAMSPERVVEHLKAVLEKEMVAFEDGALWELGRAADGSMRDALSLTDQAIAFGNGRLTNAEVRSMLGSIDRDLVFRVLEAVNSGDAAAVIEVCAQLAEQSVDFAGALAELVSALHRVALAQMLPDAVDNSLGDRERLLAVAAAMTAEDVQLYYQIALQGRRDMAWAADLRSGFEMTLLRMLAFRPVPTAPGAQAGGNAARPAAGAARPAPRPAPAGPQAVARAAAPVAASPAVVAASAPAVAAQVRAERVPVATPSATPAAVPVVAPVSNVVPFPSPPEPEPEVARRVPSAPGEICGPAAWEQWVRDSGLAGGALNLARHGALVAAGEGGFELQLSPRHEILASGLSFGQLEAAFLRHFPDARLKLARKEPTYTVPMQLIAQRRQARLAEAEQALRNDPVVRTLMQDFQAEILPDSITPLD
ncbi:MAG: polymerase subunit gamma/tau, partial [Moraxellaceae bacterium]|nr:polymerase subunit gamma/tau [Moraxellaceae bacterium]